MPLKGHIESVERPVFSWKDWFNGSYQNKLDKRTQHHFGFRSVFLRLKNQIDYTLFNEINARGVIEGKQGYLYEADYIKAYLGMRYVNEAEIIKKAKKIKFLQDTLAKLDKTFIVILAAGKASFYPEYFPYKYDTVQPHHLYPRRGIHWSFYGECLVADSLLKYIEHHQQVDIPDLITNRIENISPPKFSDNDLGDGMNLLFAPKPDTLSYPIIQFETVGKTKLNALIIADSHYWGLHNLGFSSKVFDEASFWFYNNDYYTTDGAYGKVIDLNTLQESLNKDVIIVMATETTLDSFAWRYINILSQKMEMPGLKPK